MAGVNGRKRWAHRLRQVAQDAFGYDRLRPGQADAIPFGEQTAGPCGYCDRCDSGAIVSDAASQPFPLSSRVLHPQWGAGQVLRYKGDTMVVLFDTVGYKTLAAAIVAEQGLLKQL